MLKMIQETIYDPYGNATDGPDEDFGLSWIGRGDVIRTVLGEQVTVVHIDATGDVSVAPGAVLLLDDERYPDRRYIAHHYPATAVAHELGLFHVENR